MFKKENVPFRNGKVFSSVTPRLWGSLAGTDQHVACYTTLIRARSFYCCYCHLIFFISNE